MLTGCGVRGGCGLAVQSAAVGGGAAAEDLVACEAAESAMGPADGPAAGLAECAVLESMSAIVAAECEAAVWSAAEADGCGPAAAGDPAVCEAAE